jgi:hypothetical protein
MHTLTYTVEKLNPWLEWTPVTTHYACRLSEVPPTGEQKNKAWSQAFERALNLEKAGIKARIVEAEITATNSTVWEGK